MARHHSAAAERVVILAVFGAILTFVFWLSLRVQRPPTSDVPLLAGAESQPSPTTQPSPAFSPAPSPSAGVAATPLPSVEPTQAPGVLPSLTPEPPPSVAPGSLVIPVKGVRPGQLRDTFTEARSEGRTHNAIDIMAACETPVVAAVAGKLVRFFTSERGGLTIYQLGPDNRTVYYYAHLSRYADGLAPGQLLQPGELIGFVGDTGNAGPGNCHLHFAMWTVTDPKRFWSGDDINPYPLLRQAR
jgi:peptidoglycan LD-endopeptidase LytH